ncbi:MAG: DUF2892 domain-containing protein [Acidobacteria bacterium]|nr:DUF2892 domain-containing protein [Acidobacteriota bacterium]
MERSPSETGKRERYTNMTETERWISAASGGFLAVYGVKRGGWSGWLLALLGGGLVYRGATGYCDVYALLNINTADGKGRNAVIKHGESIKVEKSLTINQSPEALYRYWRNLENLPTIMNHLEAVRVIDHNLSHWVAKAPAGMTVEWDAEIIVEKANEMLAWRSLEGAYIPNAGSVHFQAAPDGRGTEVKVVLAYDAPGGQLGYALAKLFGEEPGQQVEDDLRRFKQVMEAGEVVALDGQPSSKSGAMPNERIASQGS